MLHKLFKRNSLSEQQASILYNSIVVTARSIEFYQTYKIPDTPLGRFEMLSLITALMLYRLKHNLPADNCYNTNEISQEIVDNLSADLDICIRDITNEDLKVGRRIKKMVQGFYGRLIHVHDALENKSQHILKAILLRNTYGFVETEIDDAATQLSERVLSIHKNLANIPLIAILDMETFA